MKNLKLKASFWTRQAAYATVDNMIIQHKNVCRLLCDPDKNGQSLFRVRLDSLSCIHVGVNSKGAKSGTIRISGFGSLIE